MWQGARVWVKRGHYMFKRLSTVIKEIPVCWEQYYLYTEGSWKENITCVLSNINHIISLLPIEIEKATPTRAIIDESKVILHNVGVSSVKTSLKERSLEFFQVSSFANSLWGSFHYLTSTWVQIWIISYTLSLKFPNFKRIHFWKGLQIDWISKGVKMPI